MRFIRLGVRIKRVALQMKAHPLNTDSLACPDDIVTQLGPANSNSRLFRVPHYFKHKTISLGFARHLLAMSYLIRSVSGFS